MAVRFRVFVPFAGTLKVPPGAREKSMGLTGVGASSLCERRGPEITPDFFANENSISKSCAPLFLKGSLNLDPALAC